MSRIIKLKEFKRIYVVISLFFYPVFFYGQTWLQLNTGVNQDLHSISIIDTNNFWVAGQNGLILKTTDSGLTWINYVAANSTIFSISFQDFQNGVFSTIDDKIYNTTNGGQNWDLKFQSSYLDGPLSNVFVLALNNYFFVKGDYNSPSYRMHYKSINQGNSWTMIQFLNSDYAFPTPSSLYFIDPENGYYIIKTAYNGNCISFTNDGAHWYYSNIDNNIFVHSDLNSLFLLKGVNN